MYGLERAVLGQGVGNRDAAPLTWPLLSTVSERGTAPANL